MRMDELERFPGDAGDEGTNWDVFGRPGGWLRHEPGINPWSKQAEILGTLRTHRRVAVRSCSGSGKTFPAACAVNLRPMSFGRSAIAISTAPTGRQVKEPLWRHIRDIHITNASSIGGTLTPVGLDFSPTRYARGFSIDSPGRFRGFHNANIQFVVDDSRRTAAADRQPEQSLRQVLRRLPLEAVDVAPDRHLRV